MKKKLFFCVAGLATLPLLCVHASANPISVGFTNLPNQGIVSPVFAGETSIDFSMMNQSAPSCSGTEASLCTAANVILSSQNFASGVSETFNFGNIQYTTSAGDLWQVVAGPGGTLDIFTYGTFTGTGVTPAPGDLNFSFQPPPVGPYYTYSASGTETPEPGTITMFGLGLAAIAVSAGFRKRRNPLPAR